MKYLILTGPQARQAACNYILHAPEGWSVKIAEPTRNLEQNALMWVLLEAFSEQLKWPVNGKLVNLTAEEWKDVTSAAFESTTVRLAQGLDGGVVMLGRRTSQYGKAKMTEFIEFLLAVGTERGVVFNEVAAA